MSVLNVDDFLTRLLNVGQSKLTANVPLFCFIITIIV